MAYGRARFELSLDNGEQIAPGNRFFLVRLGLTLGALVCLRHGFEIREQQFRLDDVDVASRIDLSGDVRHVLIREAAHEMQDRMRLADVREKLVAEPFAL